jgi:hypothetical protein
MDVVTPEARPTDEVTELTLKVLCSAVAMQTLCGGFRHSGCVSGMARVLLRLRRPNGRSGRHHGKLRLTSDPTYESRIQAALRGLKSRLYKSVAAAAKAQNVCLCSLFGVGTVEELKTRIKGYLADPSHVDIAQNPRFSALFQVSGKTCARNPPIMNNTHSQEPALNFDPMVSHLSFSIVDSPSLQPQAIREHTQTYPHYTAWPQDDIYDTYTYFSHPVPTTSQFDGYQVASSSNLKRQSL